MKSVALKLPNDQTITHLDDKISYFLAEQDGVILTQNHIPSSTTDFYEIPNRGVILYTRSAQEPNTVNPSNFIETKIKSEQKVAGVLTLLGFDETDFYFAILESSIRVKLKDYLG